MKIAVEGRAAGDRHAAGAGEARTGVEDIAATVEHDAAGLRFDDAAVVAEQPVADIGRGTGGLGKHMGVDE